MLERERKLEFLKFFSRKNIKQNMQNANLQSHHYEYELVAEILYDWSIVRWT